MIQKILSLMSEFYVTYTQEPNYILISDENYSQLKGEIRPLQHKYLGLTMDTGIATFHGLKIVIVKGKDRLELA